MQGETNIRTWLQGLQRPQEYYWCLECHENKGVGGRGPGHRFQNSKTLKAYQVKRDNLMRPFTVYLICAGKRRPFTSGSPRHIANRQIQKQPQAVSVRPPRHPPPRSHHQPSCKATAAAGSWGHDETWNYNSQSNVSTG